MPDASIWRIWQILDSAFPVGGFSHSAGLEAAWQGGWIRSSDDAAAFVRESLNQLTHSTLPFIVAAVRGDDPLALDRLQDTYLTNHVANRASRLQGMTFLATASEVFSLPALTAFRESLLKAESPGHLAMTFGVVMKELAVPVPMALKMFLFMNVRGILSAGVRLGVIGPYEAQRLQAALDPALDQAAAEGATLTLDDVCQTAPLLELLQMGQDRLYSRLFQS